MLSSISLIVLLRPVIAAVSVPVLESLAALVIAVTRASQPSVAVVAPVTASVARW